MYSRRNIYSNSDQRTCKKTETQWIYLKFRSVLPSTVRFPTLRAFTWSIENMGNTRVPFWTFMTIMHVKILCHISHIPPGFYHLVLWKEMKSKSYLENTLQRGILTTAKKTYFEIFLFYCTTVQEEFVEKAHPPLTILSSVHGVNDFFLWITH